MGVKPGYKETEVGVIPEDWEVKTLGEVGKPIIGLTYKPDNIAQEGTLVLRSSNIKNSRLAFSDNVYVNSPVSKELKIRKGDLLICVRNGSRDLIGKAALIDFDSEFVTFGAFMSIFRSNMSEYIFSLFQSDIIGRQIKDNLGATINQITNKNIKEFVVPLPPLTEQQAIASALSDTDDLIAALEALIAKKQAIKQGAMQELLTGRKRLLGFEGEWEEKRLGDIVRVVAGGTPSTSEPSFWDGDIPWCTPTDLTAEPGKYLQKTQRKITANGMSNSAATMLPPGTLLFCSRASVGEMKIATFPVTTNQGFQALICGPQAYNEFLYYLINLEVGKFLEVAKGSTFLEISGRAIRNTVLEVPNIEEQQAIASILYDMDSEIAQLEDQLGKARALKQGMMQELLTGRIRLLGDYHG